MAFYYLCSSEKPFFSDRDGSGKIVHACARLEDAERLNEANGGLFDIRLGESLKSWVWKMQGLGASHVAHSCLAGVVKITPIYSLLRDLESGSTESITTDL